MFKKIAALTATLTVAFTFGVVTANATTTPEPTDGPCVMVVHNDDPTITAQRGNCPEPVVEPTTAPVEVAPTPAPSTEPAPAPTSSATAAPAEAAPAPTYEAQGRYSTFLAVMIKDPSSAGKPWNYVVTDKRTGKPVLGANGTLPADGYRNGTTMYYVEPYPVSKFDVAPTDLEIVLTVGDKKVVKALDNSSFRVKFKDSTRMQWQADWVFDGTSFAPIPK